jgi:DNA-binding CsgD family transcriptional regulator
MTTLNPVHVALLVHFLLVVFLSVYIVRSGLKEYLNKILFVFVLLTGSWSASILGATSAMGDAVRSAFCSASLFASFLIPPTTLLFAFHLRKFHVPRAAFIALTYLPGLVFLAISLTVPSGGYSFAPSAYGDLPHAVANAISTKLNLAVTVLYIPAAFVLFLLTWIKPKNRRAKRQSTLFLLASLIGMVSTLALSVQGMPLQFIPSMYSYVLFIYINMRLYRLGLGAPSFVKDRLWDLVREELILTDGEGTIVSWNAKAAIRYGLGVKNAKNVSALFTDDGSLRDFISCPQTDCDATLDGRLLRVEGRPEDLVSLTARQIRDAFGDRLGFVFMSAGSMPYDTFKELYGITPKEWEVIGLLAMGKEYKEIGELLFVSPFTVKNHVHSTYQKLGVNNRYELLPRLFPL